MKKRNASTNYFRFRLGLCILAVLMIVVWEQLEALRLRKEMKTLRRDVDQLVFENARYSQRIQSWATLPNLEKLAKSRYAMTPYKPQQTKTLPSL